MIDKLNNQNFKTKMLETIERSKLYKIFSKKASNNYFDTQKLKTKKSKSRNHKQ